MSTENEQNSAVSSSEDLVPESADTPASVAGSESRIAELEAEVAEFRDKWLRAEAEMQNLRARTKREVEDVRQYAIQKFATDILEVAENLRRGLANLPPPETDESELAHNLRSGFEGIERQFIAILARNGIERDDPTGKAFDPERHQAMAQQPSVEHPPGTVVQAWSGAWTLNGRLMKPAMVVVSTTT